MLLALPVFIVASLALPLQSGTLLVANKASLSISFIDESSLETIFELKIGDSPKETPHEIAVNPSGTKALVSHYGKVSFNFKRFEFDNSANPGSRLSLIDIIHGKTIKHIELLALSSPHGIQFLSDTEAIVTAEGIQSLVKIDFSNLADIKISYFPIPGKGAHLIVIDSAKKFAFVANKDSGSVVKFDLEKNRSVKEQEVGRHAEGIVLSADGKRIFVTDRLSDKVTFLATKTLAVELTIATESGPIRVALFDNGKSALLTNAVRGTIQLINLGTQTISRGFKSTHTFSFGTGRFLDSIFGALKVPVSILVNDDQKTAYISNSYAGNITKVNLEERKVITTFVAGGEPDGLALSPLKLVINHPILANHKYSAGR